MIRESNPEIENIRRRLTKLMLTSIVITFTMFAIVITALIYKLNKSAPTINLHQEINLVKDSKIISQQLNNNKISLFIKNNNNSHILIYDFNKQKLITDIKINN